MVLLFILFAFFFHVNRGVVYIRTLTQLNVLPYDSLDDDGLGCKLPRVSTQGVSALG